jgi:hypothetical protein
METDREREEFRRMHLNIKVERVEGLIASYQKGISFYIKRLNNYYDLMGRVAERLGEPEPEELP